jgi:GTP-binding protein
MKLAIIGRPNVGKSTLFNRLAGKKLALVDDMPGVTRDRRYAMGNLGGVRFEIIDTAGLEEAPADALESRMMAQTRTGLREADGVLFMVDARDGITAPDEAFARELHKSGKPVVLLVNKAEGRAAHNAMSDVYQLGFSHVAFISAEHGEGLGDLFDAMCESGMITAQSEESADKTRATRRQKERARAEALLAEQEAQSEPDADTAPLTIAILGRPNAGKSTLVNALLGEDRLLTSPVAGTTRDAITLPFTFQGRDFKLVDTAGMRKRAKVNEKLEKLAVADGLRAMRFAHVVVVLLDATAPLEKQDAAIAALVEREGRACIIGLNKWDLVKTDKKEFLTELNLMLGEHISQLGGLTLVPCSALRHDGLDKLMQACLDAYAVWNKRVPTAALNRWLDGVVQHHSPPLVRGRRLKVKYMAQIKTRPPTFQLNCNMDKEFPEAYLRYLVNGLRESFGFPGVPLRLQLKASENPFAKKKKS